MDFASIANAVVLIGAGVALLIALLATGLRNIGPDERLVVARFGIFETNVRGPGMTFLIPLIERGFRVSLLRQHFEIADVPAVTADGRGLSADFDFRFRIFRPLAFVYEVPAPFAAGLRILSRSALAYAAKELPLGDALNRGVLEESAVPILLNRLAAAGTADVQVRMTGVRAVPIRTDEDEQKRLVLLGMTYMAPDPDSAGSRTFGGDVVWAVRKVGRMARWGIVVIAIVALGVQVVGIAGLQPWTPLSLLVGLFLGTLTVPLAEFRGEVGTVFRAAGARRMVLWMVVLAAWAAATLGLVFLLLFAAGLDAPLEGSQ